MKMVVSVSKGTPLQVNTTPPVPADVTMVAIPRGVVITWSSDVYVRPYYWQYAIGVGAEVYGDWQDTLYPIVIRELTAAEVATYGYDATIYFKVRSTNGLGDTSAEASDTEDALSLSATVDDVLDAVLTAAKLATAVTDRMFTTSDRSGADLKAATVTLAKLASDATTRMFDNDSRVAADVTNVNSIAAATVTAGAADGASTKIVVDANKTTWDTVTTKLDQTAVEARIIAVRPDATYKNSEITTTTLGLENVENKDGATLISDSLTEALIKAADGVTNGTGSNLAASINSLSDAIDSDAIEELAAVKVKTAAGGTALFDASGNLVFTGAVGIKSGATVITPAMIIAAINTSGESKNIRLDDIAAGDLDDIDDGTTYEKCTVNEHTGAGYAYYALNSSYMLKTGTVNYSVAEIEADVQNIDILHNAGELSTTTVVTDFADINVAPDGTDQLIMLKSVYYQKGTTSFSVRFLAETDDPTIATIKVDLLSELGVATTAVQATDTIDSTGTYAVYEITIDVPTGGSAGTWYILTVKQNATTSKYVKIKNLRVFGIKT